MDLSKLPFAWQFLAAGLIAVVAFADKLGPLAGQLLRALGGLSTPKPADADSDAVTAITDDDAFDAARIMVMYFEHVKCPEGAAAARECGRCLFHEHSEASAEVMP